MGCVGKTYVGPISSIDLAPSILCHLLLPQSGFVGGPLQTFLEENDDG
jgi:hypothetical protein